ncbi:MAG: DUF4159 domain-containing protein [Pseudomonadota bacterium]
MTLGALSFASPLVLLGLLALPIIWWLLRLTPPRPRQEVFPPSRILEEIAKPEETPAQSPWWLTLLRLLLAGLVVLALSEPVWNADEAQLNGDGPILLVVDDGWTSGANWNERMNAAEQTLKEASAAGRPVALVFASELGQAELATASADSLSSRLSAARALPINTHWSALGERIASADVPEFATLVWLTGGLKAPGHDVLKQALEAKVTGQVFVTQPGETALAATAINNAPNAMEVAIVRADNDAPGAGQATAYDDKGQSIATAPFSFSGTATTASAQFELPVELRNEIVRVELDNQKTAGAVQLIDERFRRRRVGLISGGNADRAQPLLSPLYYISRALQPFSDVREPETDNSIEAVDELINERISTFILADIGQLPDETTRKLEDWVTKGGMLVRFAGPRLAAASDDRLVPVSLRRGGRSLGGTLTWGEAQPLSSFEDNSPFGGIPVPDDVSVTRQVLAEPDIDLASKTWASLQDGTPLVTASQQGQGWIVLFHVTADASWSNLPLSGAFVDMLRRIVAVSNGAVTVPGQGGTASESSTDAQTETASLAPWQVLNGEGRLGAPDSEARPLQIAPGTEVVVSRETPPGFYGTSDAHVAVNLFSKDTALTALTRDDLPQGGQFLNYQKTAATEFKPWLLALAFVLLAIDCLVVLWMAGALRTRRVLSSSTAGIAVAALATASILTFTMPQSAFAQDAAIDFESALKTRLAYVKTGDDRLDAISRKGLIGLTRFISTRTSLEPGEPIGVDIANDELAFYPLLYWPISSGVSVPPAETMARIDAFMKRGGSVLFDTRDQISGGFGGARVTVETQRLREILSSLDIPPLEPVPENHVLTRAFYLLNVFPGRYLDGRLWVEASTPTEDDADRPARPGDGVSSIMITSNDMAGAWAIEADGSPSLPIVPPNPTQRVYALRTGANIVMYTLTGNYKSDQVHIPALLERLGQ